MMIVFVPFLTFFVLAIIFRIVLSSAGSRRNKEFKEIIEEERNANFYRKKEIPEEVFCKPNLDTLPIKEYDENDDIFASIRATQEDLIKKANRKMIRLTPPLSNIEIKKKFGYANLDFIIECEENYYTYVNSLNMFAQSLIKISDYESAEKVLKHSMFDMESNIFKTYNLMCEVYEATNEKDKLIQILSQIDTIETLKYNEDLKNKIKIRFKEVISTL